MWISHTYYIILCIIHWITEPFISQCGNHQSWNHSFPSVGTVRLEWFIYTVIICIVGKKCLYFRFIISTVFFYMWTCTWYNFVFVQYVYTFNIPRTLFIWLKEGEGKCSKESKKCPKNDEEEEEEEEEEEYRKYEGNNKSKRLTFKRKSKKGFQMCSFSHKLFEKCFIVANVSLLWDYPYAKHVSSFQLLVFIYSSLKYTCQMLDFASCSEVKYCICYWICILRYST